MRFIVSQSPSLAAFAAYLLVTTSLTWPAVTQLSTSIVGRMGGDNYEHIWYLWWLGEVIFDTAGSPSTIPILNHPSGIYAPLNLTHTPALFLPSILARVITPVTAFNIALIVAPALNALSMYWLALELTGHRRPAFLGGLLFGFTPHAIGHLQAGHLSQITMMGFPLFALYFLRLVHKPTWRNAGFTGVFAFLATSHPSHLAYFILPVSLTILAATRIHLRNRRAWISLAGAALLASAMLAPFYVPVLASRESIADHATELGGSVTKSMDLASFFTPPPGNPWLPPTLHSFAARVVGNADESHGYIGAVTLLLALLGFCVKRHIVAWWAALAGVSLLLSLGPLLRLSGNLLTIRIDSGNYPLQLPHAILTQLPLFSWSRTPARFGATMHFSLALLAAYGMAVLMAKVRRHHWKWLITGVLCALAMAERVIIWPFPSTPSWPNHSLRDIASEDHEHVVLNIPDSFTTNNLALYGQTLHQLPIVGGTVFRSGQAQIDLAFFDALMRPTHTTDIVPVPHHIDRMSLLQSYNVGVVVNQHLAENYDPVQREYLLGTFGAPYAVSKSETIFRIHGTATPPPHLTFALDPDEWHQMEQWGNFPARWFTDSARVYLHNTYQEAGRLQFTLIPGHKLHRIQISVNGSHLTTVISGDWATYVTPNVTLPSGLSTITFTDLDGAEEVWGDLRCVGITPLAGQLTQPLDCDPHRKGQRLLSVAVQEIAWQPHLYEPSVALFGQSIALENVSWQEIISPNDNVEIIINARSLERIDDDLVVFVHVLNQDGVLLSQWDDAPLRGQFATSAWDLGQQLGFRVEVPIPTASLPGNYQLELGWYNPTTGSRLPITSTLMNTHDNVLVLGSFAIKDY